MLRIKPLYRNNKGRFMLATAIISSLILIGFGLAMMFSPSVQKAIELFNSTVKIKDSMTIGGQKVDFENQSDTSIFITVNIGNSQYNAILPSKFLLIYWPLGLGGFLFLILFIQSIFLTIGFKNINKKNVHQIVNPIRSYTIAIIFSWITFFLITISVFLIIFSGSILFTNTLTLFQYKTFTLAIADLKINNNVFSDWFKSTTNTDFSVYWITAHNFNVWFKQTNFNKYKQLNLLYPVMAFIPFILMQFISALLGPISWGWINLCVLAAVGDEVAMEILNEKMYKSKKVPTDERISHIYSNASTGTMDRHTSEITGSMSMMLDDEGDTYSNVNTKYLGDELASSNPDINFDEGSPNSPKKIMIDIQDGDLSHKIDAEGYNLRAKLKARCISFFKNNIKLMELSENSNLTIYNKFKTTYDALVLNKVDNKISKIASGVEEYINFATEIDQKFVDLISRVLSKSRHIFGRYASDLDDLVTNYFNSVREWNLFKAEMYIEQIFAIAAANVELLAKVGYTLKYRLANNYTIIEEKLSALHTLNSARKSRDYESYRRMCFKVIEHMSPRKQEFNNLISKMY